MNGGAWWAAVHGVLESQTRLKRLSSSNRHLWIIPGSFFPLPWQRSVAVTEYVAWSLVYLLSGPLRNTLWTPLELGYTREQQEKATAPHSSTLAWKIPWMEEPGRLQSMGSLQVGHDWATSLSLLCIGEGNGNPLQCSCLENPRDGGAWRAAVYRVAESRTRLKWLSSSSSSSRKRKQQGAERWSKFQLSVHHPPGWHPSPSKKRWGLVFLEGCLPWTGLFFLETKMPRCLLCTSVHRPREDLHINYQVESLSGLDCVCVCTRLVRSPHVGI